MINNKYFFLIEGIKNHSKIKQGGEKAIKYKSLNPFYPKIPPS